MTWRVLATRGCGSSIVEAALVLCGVAYDREELDYTREDDRAKLAAVNPLAQVPTLVMPDGGVMTESAAIALYLDEQYPAAGLLPPVGDATRRDALRWLVFLVAAVYPTFTYGDEPAKWAGPELRESTNRHREKLWRQIEGEIRGPWFLGERFSMLDVYIGVMTRWRPRRGWFAQNCPKLAAIATAVDNDPRLAGLWASNF
jgi:GST-like protein